MNRDCSLQFRVDLSEKTIIKNAAKRVGMMTSAFIRQAVMRYINANYLKDSIKEDENLREGKEDEI